MGLAHLIVIRPELRLKIVKTSFIGNKAGRKGYLLKYYVQIKNYVMQTGFNFAKIFFKNDPQTGSTTGCSYKICRR
jgi:hypothetical protein